MPVIGQNAFFKHIRVRAGFQHLNIVVRFNENKLCSRSLIQHGFVNAADIGHVRKLASTADEYEADGLLCVMRRFERKNIDVSDIEIFICAKNTHVPEIHLLHDGIHCLPCAGIGINGHIVLA